MVDDIVDTRRVSCPNEYMNIQIRTSNNSETTMPVYRSKFDPTTGTSANSPRKLVGAKTYHNNMESSIGTHILRVGEMDRKCFFFLCILLRLMSAFLYDGLHCVRATEY